MLNMKKLRQIVERSDTRAGRAFDWTVQALVLVSLASFSVETLPNLPPAWQELLSAVEVITVGLFTLEYLLRVLVAERKARYVFSFFGLVDLIAIAPFYLSTGLDLRALRAVRFLRVFRLLKLARYGQAMDRMRRAFLLVREELVLFFVAALIFLYISAVGIYFFEHEAQPERFASVFDGLWWAAVTLSTVGYGDVYPVTVGGRFFTVCILLLGLGIVAVPTGLFASALSRVRQGEESRKRPLS